MSALLCYHAIDGVGGFCLVYHHSIASAFLENKSMECLVAVQQFIADWLLIELNHLGFVGERVLGFGE